jgi:hypothetical protein
MSTTYTNKHGRKQTRGARPYLLLPKVLCVGAYFGGLLAMLVAEEAGEIHRVIVLPALGAAMLLGAGLLAMHGGILLKMRWLSTKLLLTMFGLVGGHIWFESRGGIAPIVMLVGVTVLVVILGRHKPRLGQNVATVYQQRKMKERTA